MVSSVRNGQFCPRDRLGHILHVVVNGRNYNLLAPVDKGQNEKPNHYKVKVVHCGRHTALQLQHSPIT